MHSSAYLFVEYKFPKLILEVLVTTIDAQGHFYKQDNHSTVGRDRGCRVGEVQANTISLMPDHNGFKLQ